MKSILCSWQVQQIITSHPDWNYVSSFDSWKGNWSGYSFHALLYVHRNSISIFPSLLWENGVSFSWVYILNTMLLATSWMVRPISIETSWMLRPIFNGIFSIWCLYLIQSFLKKVHFKDCFSLGAITLLWEILKEDSVNLIVPTLFHKFSPIQLVVGWGECPK